MLQRVNVEVIDGAGGRKMGHGAVGSAAPVPLTVERGLVLAPEVLQRLLPDVAIVVKGAMQSAGRHIKTEQPPPLNSQLVPSEKQDNQPLALEQKPPQHKSKKEQAKQQNLESHQRWNMFPCNLCTLRFPSRPALNEHRLNHELFKSFGIQRQERRVKPKKQYKCNFCPQLFPIKELRQLHMKIHVKNKNDRRKNQENLVCCNSCEKYFSNLFELRAHKRRTACFLKDMLVPRQVHSCRICSEEFDDTFDLTSHLRTHGAPLKSYSVKKPKSNSVGTKPHTDTKLSYSISAWTPKLPELVNTTKAQEDRELKDNSSDSNLNPPGSVNATSVHKDRNLGDSFSAQNPKPTTVNAREAHKDTQLGGSDSVYNLKGLVNATKAHKNIELGKCFSSRNPMPTRLTIVNDPKSYNDLGAIDSAQKPKPDSINATKTHKRAFRACNRLTKTYTQSKLPKLTDTANCPTANNGTMITKKVTIKEVSINSLNEHLNVEAANLQISNVSEVQSQENAELTNMSCTDSNKNIMPSRYNFRDSMFAINSVTIKEAFREKIDKDVNTEDSDDSCEEHEIKEGIVLRPELLQQLGIDLNEVNAVNNNIEYLLPDTGNGSVTDETAYDTGIHSEINKRNMTLVKAEEPEFVFEENVSEYGNDVWSNAIVKKEPQELDDKERMIKAMEYDNESMIKTELLSLCKDELEDESVLGLLLHDSQDVAFEVQSRKDTAADNKQNRDTVIVKEEFVEFTENISDKTKDLVNAALEAAWKELYAEHEAMELALVKIEKDPEITDTMDCPTDIVNKLDTVRVKEEEVLEGANITEFVDLTIIGNKTDTVNLKDESEVLGGGSDNDDRFHQIMDDHKNPQGIKLDKVDLDVEQARLYVDHQIKSEIVLGPVRLQRPDVAMVPNKEQTELTDR